MQRTDIYLGLGSNLGDRHTVLLQAIDRLIHRVGPMLRCSSFIESAPMGFESDHPFMNAVVLLQTELSPRQVLEVTQQIERELGRTEKSKTSTADAKPIYHDRTIDIDILLYGDQTVCEPDLQIPHPRMEQRPFVMDPLHEVQAPPGWAFSPQSPIKPFNLKTSSWH